MERRSITRKARTAFVILIDQSGSMADRVTFNGDTMSKAEVVALLCNAYLRELILRCCRDGECRDYYDVAVVSYSGSGVESVLGNGESIFVPITDLESFHIDDKIIYKERDLGDGAFTIEHGKVSRWVEVKHSGTTPMHEALSFVAEHLREWCANAGDSVGYPPIVFNITDGVVSDSEMLDLGHIFNEIKSIKSSQGEVLLLNIHIAPAERAPKQTLFPTHKDIEQCDCRYLKGLFEGASDMPEEFASYICRELGVDAPKDGVRFKGLGYNTSLSSLFMMLNIGSTSVRRG